MSNALTVASSDRLLILAPHPDDESIATGGLIQIALRAGAAVRVIVLTDGDNNPWPQRWIEKRWRIDAAARARWGARRREEARAAMRVLGLGDDAATFLGLPDLGLTDLLMHKDEGVIRALRGTIDEFKPTLLVMPAVSDRHPDHSAAHILARAALAGRVSAPPHLYTFAVHGYGEASADITIALAQQERERKRAAILAHETQMRLSRSRFLRYADSSERFRQENASAEENPEHPLHARLGADRRLRVSVDRARWRGAWRGRALFVALDDGSRVLRQLSRDEESGAGLLHTEIECPSNAPGYVKLALPQPGWRVFDAHGWQRIMRS